jgi:hypothetical protein
LPSFAPTNLGFYTNPAEISGKSYLIVSICQHLSLRSL